MRKVHSWTRLIGQNGARRRKSPKTLINRRICHESGIHFFHPGAHGVDVVGMFFFEDNTYVLVKGDPLGERLAKVAK